MSAARQAKRGQFSEDIYQLLRRYQRGEMKGNSTAVGQLDQPLTELYDEILASHKRVYEPEVHRTRKEKV